MHLYGCRKVSKSPSGRVVKTLNNYYAYIPNPLPTELESVSSKLLKLATDAERTVGKLSGIGTLVPNPNFLVIPYTRLEAVASSRIEGTQTSLSELFYFEAASERPKPSDDVIEVENYLKALKFGVERLETLPLSLRLVRELHERLMTNVRGGSSDKTPGEFRRSQNWIGPAGCNLNNATFVPPPHDELMNVLGQWELFLHEHESLPLLIQCALMHYQFETIHPFLDGNGRVGRLLIILFLCERKALPYPLLYLSAYFERYGSDYYDLLLAVSQKGEWHKWIEFFLQGVIIQGEHAIESARRIVGERERYRQILQTDKASSSVLSLLDLIFINPYLNIQQAARSMGVSYPTAQNSIKQLEKLGILEEVTNKSRNRLYVARQLLELLVSNEPIYTPNK